MYCLDTYALIEIHNNNPNFLSILNKDFVITDLTMAEFYGIILREYNEKTANYLFRKFEAYLKQVEMTTLIKAVKFRYENKKQNLSFFDYVGYIFAVENNMKFVTGDKQFEERENVEYIKKD